ncbi:MAG: DUF3626 domain-containing protein [Bacteroidota bacterium]
MRTYNKLAIDYIEAYAKNRVVAAQASIGHVAEMSNITLAEIIGLKASIREKARIALHFHPYRLVEDSLTVVESMLQTGKYSNQFETKVSNGSLTAFKGGKRDVWENLLFGGIYDKHDIPNFLRPIYGSLSLVGHSNGPSPRFGSCYFLTKPALSKYATFTYLDSYTKPKEKGTRDCFEEILACLLSECFERDAAIGEVGVRPDDLVRKIDRHLNKEGMFAANSPMSRNLDHYIEAQIHTEIVLSQDVDYLVADAAYRGTAYEAVFKKLCTSNSIELLWNEGRALAVEAIPKNFRGPGMPAIGREIAVDHKIDASILGLAEKRYREEIRDEAARIDKNQQLKYLWHILVKYGQPIVLA